MTLPLVKHGSMDAAIGFWMGNVPSSDELLTDFCEYFKNQWMSRISAKYWNLRPMHLWCNNAVEGTYMIVLITHSNVNASVFALILAYNNRLQYRFRVHLPLWSFIHFLQHEESLVLMRSIQSRNGNCRGKALPFSMANEQAGKKTQQVKNLAVLYVIGSVDLKPYLTSLASFVGNLSGKNQRRISIETVRWQMKLTLLMVNNPSLKAVNNFIRSLFSFTNILVCIFSGIDLQRLVKENKSSLLYDTGPLPKHQLY